MEGTIPGKGKKFRWNGRFGGYYLNGRAQSKEGVMGGNSV